MENDRARIAELLRSHTGSIINAAIKAIPFRPYHQGATNTGVTRDLYQAQNKVLGLDPEFSYCSGAVLEALWSVLEWTGIMDAIGHELAKALWLYIYVRTDLGYPRSGVRSAIVDILKGDSLDSRPDLAGPGCFAQIYDYEIDTGKCTFGHSVICTGQTTNKSGDPAVLVWSSDRDVNNGHGEDYFSHVHPDTRKRREWWIGKIDLGRLPFDMDRSRRIIETL